MTRSGASPDRRAARELLAGAGFVCGDAGGGRTPGGGSAEAGGVGGVGDAGRSTSWCSVRLRASRSPGSRGAPSFCGRRASRSPRRVRAAPAERTAGAARRRAPAGERRGHRRLHRERRDRRSALHDPCARARASSHPSRTSAPSPCATANGVDVYRGDLFAPLPRSLEDASTWSSASCPTSRRPSSRFCNATRFSFESALSYDGGPDGVGILRGVLAGAPLPPPQRRAAARARRSGGRRARRRSCTPRLRRRHHPRRTKRATSAASRPRSVLDPHHELQPTHRPTTEPTKPHTMLRMENVLTCSSATGR